MHHEEVTHLVEPVDDKGDAVGINDSHFPLWIVESPLGQDRRPSGRDLGGFDVYHQRLDSLADQKPSPCFPDFVPLLTSARTQNALASDLVPSRMILGAFRSTIAKLPAKCYNDQHAMRDLKSLVSDIRRLAR